MPPITFALTCEELMPYWGFSGHCHLEEVGGTPPTQNIRTDQAWITQFDWRVTGMMNYFLDDEHSIWKMQLFLEKMGPGEGPSLPVVTESFIKLPLPHDYTHQYRVEAGTVPPGIYRLAASLSLVCTVSGSEVPYPVAAFAEGPVLRFYEASVI